MSEFSAVPARTEDILLRLAIAGTSGSGKTLGALMLACGLTQPGDRVVVIDTERKRSANHAKRMREEFGFEYDVCDLRPPFTPSRYIAAINAQVEAGERIIICDSITHEWSGIGGILEGVDKMQASGRNRMQAWNVATPAHNRFIETMIASPCHIIATMRTKTAWDISKDGDGKTQVQKLGTTPMQREGMEYEFDVVLDVSAAPRHAAGISKANVSFADVLRDHLQVEHMITPQLGRKIIEWMVEPNPDDVPPSTPAAEVTPEPVPSAGNPFTKPKTETAS